MKKLFFEILIEAPTEVVYKTMLSAETYKLWTRIFNETSDFEGSWEKGSKILFVGTDATGNKGGMVSFIEENIPNKYVSIKHLGILEGDQEITEGPKVEGWNDAHENYTFEKNGNATLLKIDLDSNEEFESYFSETYPAALQELKKIVEKQQ